MSTLSYKNKWTRTPSSTLGATTSYPKGSNVETPSYATSWNSIRWNKSLVDRGQSSKLASAFESTSKNYPIYNLSSTSSRYASLPTRRKPDFDIAGPTVAERRALFGEKTQTSTSYTPSSSVQTRPSRSSYYPSSTTMRSSALMNSYFPSNATKRFSTATTSRDVADIRKSTYDKPVTSTAASWEKPSVSKASDTYSRRPLSMNLTPSTADSSLSITPKADRPWRQRLTDAARLRNLHGDQVGTAISTSIAASRSRRSSISSNTNRNGEELQTSLTALKQIVDNTSTANSRYRRSGSRQSSVEAPRTYGENSAFQATLSKYPALYKYSSYFTADAAKPKQPYMSRSYSPVSSRRTLFPVTNHYTSVSRDPSPPKIVLKQPSNESVYDNASSTVTPRRTQTQTQSKLPLEDQSAPLKNKLTKEEKKARRKSKPRSATQDKSSDSSSGVEQRAESREKRLQKKRLKKKRSTKAEDKDGLDEKSNSNEISREQQKEDISADHSMEKSKIQEAASSPISSPSPDVIVERKPVEKKQVLKKQKEIVVPSEDEKDVFHSLSEGSNQALDVIPDIDARTDKADRDKNGNDIIKPVEVIDVPINVEEQDVVKQSDAIIEEAKVLAKGSKSKSMRDIALDAEVVEQLTNKTLVRRVNGQILNETERPKSEERQNDSRKLTAPVPGTWMNEEHELNISHNKRLERDTSLSWENVTAVQKVKDSSRVTPLKVLLEKKKKSFKEIIVNLALQMSYHFEEATIRRPLKSSIALTKAVLIRNRLPVTANFSCSFCRTVKNEKASTVHRPRRKIKDSCSLKASEPTDVKVMLQKDLVRVPKDSMPGDTQLTLRTSPINGRNYYRCKRRMRATPLKRQSMPSLSTLIDHQTAIIEAEKNRLAQAALTIGREDQPNALSKKKSGSVASVVLDYLRSCDEAPLRRGSAFCEEILRNEKLILPNRSVLEEFVRQKQKHFERLHSEPPFAEAEENRADSPCLSTASELIPACTVKVLEPTRNIPYITAPSRSRLSSVDRSQVDPVVRDKKTNMFDRLAQAESALSASCHGLSVPFVHNKQRSLPTMRPAFKFESPNSPFEARMQSQARLLRNSSVSSDISTLSEGNSVFQSTPTFDAPMQLTVNGRARRPSADGGTPITCNFEAAAAAASKPRHERYAAHIPVKREDNADRKSVEKMEFSSSGARDGTSKQSGDMIDQARYRHQQRSKFKDAIDYLDQIFEDLKKECDSPQSKSKPIRRIQSSSAPKKAAAGGNKPESLFLPTTSSQNNAQFVPTTSHSRVYPAPEPSKQHRFSNPAPDPRYPIVAAPQPHHSPPPMKSFKPKKVQKNEPEKTIDSEQLLGDVEVSETIVLPSAQKKLRGDRLDFTQKWLEGDIKSWVAAPPKTEFTIDGLDDQESNSDYDERSLGSCSAEVAAINSAVKRKKRGRDTSDVIPKVIEPANLSRKINGVQKNDFQNRSQPVLIRPQVVRPQPVYGFPTASGFVPVGHIGIPNGSNGMSTGSSNANFNSFPQPFRDVDARNREQDQLNNNHYPLKRVSSHNQVADKKAGLEPVWRTNQEMYNTLGSAKSEDLGMGRTNGAFVQYSPNNHVDWKPPVSAAHPNMEAVKLRSNTHQDPVLTIDALVAELELNTDQATASLKRRSFPTRFDPATNRAPDYEQPRNSRQLTNGNAALKPNAIKTDGVSKHVQKPKGASFDEMAKMLHNVASEVGASDVRPRKSNLKNNFNGVLSPFETINQERFEPSKVGAIQSMFESRANASPQRVIQSNVRPSKDDDNYYDIGDFSKLSKQRSPSYTKLVSKPHSPSDASIRSQKMRKNSPFGTHHEFAPAFPALQPPICPSSSTNSSQTGGYYSSGSSLGTSSSHASQRQPSSSRPNARQGSIVGNQSLSSQAASVDDEDDGFYDNIQVDEKRISRVSDVDNTSISSHRLPPTAKGAARFTQFLRKIGGSKPPGSAASLISLNKVATERAQSHGTLAKSNSFSNEPWKEQIINGTGNAKSASAGKKTGIGQILKNSIFGSKKKLN